MKIKVISTFHHERNNFRKDVVYDVSNSVCAHTFSYHGVINDLGVKVVLRDTEIEVLTK